MNSSLYNEYQPKLAQEDQKKKNKGRVRLSTDPQSVAARERRHRISHRLKTLQSLVPGASKLDTVSLLDHAIQYVNFLNSQIRFHHYCPLLSTSSTAGDATGDQNYLLPPPNYSSFDHSYVGPLPPLLPPPPLAASYAGDDQRCFCVDVSGGSSSSVLHF